jgi:hypothetical protein
MSIKIRDERHTTNLKIQTSVLMINIILTNTISYTQFTLHNSTLTHLYLTATHWWFQYTKNIYTYINKKESKKPAPNIIWV